MEGKERDFDLTVRFDPVAMQEVMRHPEIYWSAADALSPPPDDIDFIAHMVHPHTFTYAATWHAHIVGYVQFVKRTTISAEIHTGFLPQFRGRVAKAFICAAIARAFELGFVNLWAIIPADNKGALFLARQIGFRETGRLPLAIVRRGPEGTDPRRDLVLLNLSRV